MRNKEVSSAALAEPAQGNVSQSPFDQEPFPSGAVISGKVLYRTRREIKDKEGKSRFNIALSVLGNQGVFIVQRWSDQPAPADLPVVGQDVRLPVRISAYVMGGVPRVRLELDDGRSSGAF